MSERIKLKDMTLGQIKDLKKEIQQSLFDVLNKYQEKYELSIIKIEWSTDINTVWANPDGSANFDFPTGEVLIRSYNYDINITFSDEETD